MNLMRVKTSVSHSSKDYCYSMEKFVWYSLCV